MTITAPAPHVESFSLVTAPMDATLFSGAEPGCEHPVHFSAKGHTSPRHAAGGEVYVRFFATDCGHINTSIKVVCGKFAEYIMARETAECIVCNRSYPTKDAIKIVGLVTDYHH